MTAATKGMRKYVDNWEFWFSALTAAVLIGGGLLYSHLRDIDRARSRDDAARAAQMRASNLSQVAACYTSVKNAPVVAGFLQGFYAIDDNSIANSREAIREHPHDPLNKIRRTSIANITVARVNLDSLSEVIEGTTPTIPKCRALARRLAVDYRPYEKQIRG